MMRIQQKMFRCATVALGLIASGLRAEGDPNVLASSQRIEAKSETLLNVEYRLLIKSLSVGEVAELSQLEREWIDYRDRFLAGPEVTSAENVDLARSQTRTELNLERIRFFKIYTGKNVTTSIEGNYDDFNGGLMTVKDEGKGVYSLDLSTVRGHSASNGSISGTFRLDREGKGRLVAGGDEEGTCILQLHRVKNRIFIDSESDGCESFHGLQARFPGRYYKTDFKK